MKRAATAAALFTAATAHVNPDPDRLLPSGLCPLHPPDTWTAHAPGNVVDAINTQSKNPGMSISIPPRGTSNKYVNVDIHIDELNDSTHKQISELPGVVNYDVELADDRTPKLKSRVSNKIPDNLYDYNVLTVTIKTPDAGFLYDSKQTNTLVVYIPKVGTREELSTKITKAKCAIHRYLTEIGLSDNTIMNSFGTTTPNEDRVNGILVSNDKIISENSKDIRITDDSAESLFNTRIQNLEEVINDSKEGLINTPATNITDLAGKIEISPPSIIPTNTTIETIADAFKNIVQSADLSIQPSLTALEYYGSLKKNIKENKSSDTIDSYTGKKLVDLVRELYKSTGKKLFASLEPTNDINVITEQINKRLQDIGNVSIIPLKSLNSNLAIAAANDEFTKYKSSVKSSPDITKILFYRNLISNQAFDTFRKDLIKTITQIINAYRINIISTALENSSFVDVYKSAYTAATNECGTVKDGPCKISGEKIAEMIKDKYKEWIQKRKDLDAVANELLVKIKDRDTKSQEIYTVSNKLIQYSNIFTSDSIYKLNQIKELALNAMLKSQIADTEMKIDEAQKQRCMARGYVIIKRFNSFQPGYLAVDDQTVTKVVNEDFIKKNLCDLPPEQFKLLISKIKRKDVSISDSPNDAIKTTDHQNTVIAKVGEIIDSMKDRTNLITGFLEEAQDALDKYFPGTSSPTGTSLLDPLQKAQEDAERAVKLATAAAGDHPNEKTKEMLRDAVAAQQYIDKKADDLRADRRVIKEKLQQGAQHVTESGITRLRHDGGLMYPEKSAVSTGWEQGIEPQRGIQGIPELPPTTLLSGNLVTSGLPEQQALVGRQTSMLGHLTKLIDLDGSEQQRQWAPPPSRRVDSRSRRSTARSAADQVASDEAHKLRLQDWRRSATSATPVSPASPRRLSSAERAYLRGPFQSDMIHVNKVAAAERSLNMAQTDDDDARRALTSAIGAAAAAAVNAETARVSADRAKSTWFQMPGTPTVTREAAKTALAAAKSAAAAEKEARKKQKMTKERLDAATKKYESVVAQSKKFTDASDKVSVARAALTAATTAADPSQFDPSVTTAAAEKAREDEKKTRTAAETAKRDFDAKLRTGNTSSLEQAAAKAATTAKAAKKAHKAAEEARKKAETATAAEEAIRAHTDAVDKLGNAEKEFMAEQSLYETASKMGWGDRASPALVAAKDNLRSAIAEEKRANQERLSATKERLELEQMKSTAASDLDRARRERLTAALDVARDTSSLSKSGGSRHKKHLLKDRVNKRKYTRKRNGRNISLTKRNIRQRANSTVQYYKRRKSRRKKSKKKQHTHKNRRHLHKNRKNTIRQKKHNKRSRMRSRRH